MAPLEPESVLKKRRVQEAKASTAAAARATQSRKVCLACAQLMARALLALTKTHNTIRCSCINTYRFS